MEQVKEYRKTYQEYKAELDAELSRTAEGFVRIGYLLKVARDTDILKESGYENVTDFAKAEYGIDKTQVSRFIHINDKFSEGGYADCLEERYRGFGYAKLTLMLQLPDEINEELSPAYSKAEIQAIKDEVDEERAVTDLEVMMEPRPVPSPVKGLLEMLIYQLGEDSPELYVRMAAIVDLEDIQEWTKEAKEILAPDAEKTYSIRISGTGRFMVSIRGTEDTVNVTAIRTLEKNSYTYRDLKKAWEGILPADGSGTEKDNQDSWEMVYKKEFPGKTKVAPVQQSREEKKPVTRKGSKVQKARKPEPVKKEPKKVEQISKKAEQIPEKAERLQEERIVQEQEDQGNTGTEAVFYAGMRVRRVKDGAKGTIVGRNKEMDAWDVRFDGHTMNMLIFDSEIKDFDTVDWEDPQPELRDTAEIQNTEGSRPETPMPGQITVKEIIEEKVQEEELEAESTPQNPDQMAAGQDTELDFAWETCIENMLKRLNWLKGTKLSKTNTLSVQISRERIIDAAVILEKELLRRGEEI